MKDKVEQILRHNDRARANDKYLMLKVWQLQGLPIQNISFVEKFLSRSISSPESIRRMRQKFQEDGKYLPTAPVRNARRDRANAIRRNIRSGNMDLFS